MKSEIKPATKNRADKTDLVTFSVLHAPSPDDPYQSADFFARQGLLLMFFAFFGALMLATPQQLFSNHAMSLMLVISLCYMLSVHLSEMGCFFQPNSKLIINFSAILFVILLLMLSFWGSASTTILTLLFIFWLYHMSQWKMHTATLAGIIVSLICWTPSLVNLPLTHCLGWLTLLITAHLMSIVTLKNGERKIAELSGQINQLEKASGTDELTGLLNRHLVVELGQRELHRAHRMHQPLSLMLSDFEGFRCINKAYGHLAGDLFLRSISRTVLSSFRASDLVGRFDSDTFLIVLPQANLMAARKLATRLLQAVEQKEFKVLYNNLGVGMSIGVATIAPNTTVSISELISLAQDALAYAKSSPRQKIAVQQVETC